MTKTRGADEPIQTRCDGPRSRSRGSEAGDARLLRIRQRTGSDRSGRRQGGGASVLPRHCGNHPAQHIRKLHGPSVPAGEKEERERNMFKKRDRRAALSLRSGGDAQTPPTLPMTAPRTPYAPVEGWRFPWGCSAAGLAGRLGPAQDTTSKSTPAATPPVTGCAPASAGRLRSRKGRSGRASWLRPFPPHRPVPDALSAARRSAMAAPYARPPARPP